MTAKPEAGAAVVRWVWVSLPRATFGIGVENGVVVDAAPYAWGIIKRLGTADETAVAAYLRDLGAVFRDLPLCLVAADVSCRHGEASLAAGDRRSLDRRRRGLATARRRGRSGVLVRRVLRFAEGASPDAALAVQGVR